MKHETVLFQFSVAVFILRNITLISFSDFIFHAWSAAVVTNFYYKPFEYRFESFEIR